MSVEELTPAHLAEWPLEAAENITGFAERGPDGQLVSLGVVYAIDETRCKVHFIRRDGSTKLVHRWMLKIAAALRELGFREVLAECDETVPLAREWLLRGGFVQHGAEWRLALTGK